MTRLLEGEVVPDVDPEIERLRARVRTLEREKADAELATRRAQEDAARALSMLRKQLSPLYRALQAVFGELDAAGVRDDGPASAASAAPSTAKWDEWKARLGPACAKVIDALLLGGDMTVQAIAVAAKMGRNTVYAATSKMGRAGILVNNGGRFSLKQ